MALLLSAGCAEAPSPGQCVSTDEPALTLGSRRGATLVDGDELDVFPPPQGGVFTELDVSIVGVAPSDIAQLHVTVESTDTSERFASVTYPGSAIFAWCSEDGIVEIDDLPVGFEDAFGLPELAGRMAVLDGVLETRSADVSTRIDVVLRWTDY